MYLIVMKVILESKLGFHLFKKNILFVYYLLIHFYFILFYFFEFILILAQAGNSNAVISSYVVFNTLFHTISDKEIKQFQL